MAREILYNGNGQSATVNVPQMPHVMGPPQGAYNQSMDLIRSVGEDGQRIIKGMDESYKLKQETMLAAANLEAQEQMTRWQAEYMRTHKGQDALNAQNDYDQQWQAIAQSVRVKYGDRIGAEFQHKFERNLALQNIYAVAHGAQYQNQQDALWRHSVDEGSSAAYLQDIAMYHDNPAELQMREQEFVRGYQARHPGEDITKQRLWAREQVGIGIVQGYMAAGELDKAEEALNNYGGMAGDTSAYGGLGGIISSRGKKGSIADDQNNPWNLSIRGTSDATPQRQRFQRFETPEAGTYAAFNQFVRYNQGKLGAYVADPLNKNHKIPMNTIRGMVYKWQSGKTDRPWKVVADMAKSGLDVDTPFDATSQDGKTKIASMMSQLAVNESSWKIDPTQILQVVNNGGKRVPMYVAYDKPEGLSEQGNIDIANRPRVTNADGSISTVRTMGVEINGQQVLIPTVSDDGQIMTDDEAIENYKKTGKHLGKFDTIVHANAYAQRLHDQQEKMYASQPRAFTSDKYLSLHRQIEAMKRKRADDATVTKSAFSNQIALGIDTGDFSEAEKSIATMRQFKMDKDAYELEQQLAVAKTFQNLTASVSSLPLSEQGPAAQKLFDQVTNKDNAKYAITMRDHALASINKRVEAFKKDPAAAVQGDPLLQGEMSPQDRITKTLELQARMGKGLAYQPRMLPKETADNMRAEYDKCKTGTARVDYLYGLQLQFDDYTEGVLREMKMPPGMGIVLPAIQNIPRKELGAFLTGMTVKGKDEPRVDKDELSVMRDAVGNDFQLLNQVREMRKRFFDNDSIRDLENCLVRGAYYYLKDTGQTGFKSIDDAFSISSANNTFLILPKDSGVDAGEVSNHLEVYRQYKLREDLESGGYLEGTKDGNKPREYMANLNAILNNAVFISANDGKHAYLMDPKTELLIRKKDGSLFMVPFDKARSAYESRDIAAQETTEAQDIKE